VRLSFLSRLLLRLLPHSQGSFFALPPSTFTSPACLGALDKRANAIHALKNKQLIGKPIFTPSRLISVAAPAPNSMPKRRLPVTQGKAIQGVTVN
jgi:hypothetical protein